MYFKEACLGALKVIYLRKIDWTYTLLSDRPSKHWNFIKIIFTEGRSDFNWNKMWVCCCSNNAIKVKLVSNKVETRSHRTAVQSPWDCSYFHHFSSWSGGSGPRGAWWGTSASPGSVRWRGRPGSMTTGRRTDTGDPPPTSYSPPRLSDQARYIRWI